MFGYIIVYMKKVSIFFDIVYFVLAAVAFIGGFALLIDCFSSGNNEYLFWAIFLMVYFLIGTPITIKGMKTINDRRVAVGIFMIWFGNPLGGLFYLVAPGWPEEAERRYRSASYPDDEKENS